MLRHVRLKHEGESGLLVGEVRAGDWTLNQELMVGEVRQGDWSGAKQELVVGEVRQGDWSGVKQEVGEEPAPIINLYAGYDWSM